jgi:methylmalonyl-CoA mutase cobalamin-binding subunit
VAGGTITREDAEVMHRYGVDWIFFAGTPLAEILLSLLFAEA